MNGQTENNYKDWLWLAVIIITILILGVAYIFAMSFHSKKGELYEDNNSGSTGGGVLHHGGV